MSNATANRTYLKTLTVTKTENANGKFTYRAIDPEGESMVLIENSKRDIEAVTFWYSEGLELREDDCMGITWICHSKMATAYKIQRNPDWKYVEDHCKLGVIEVS